VARTVNPQAHAERRAKILAAAACEFAEHGIDGTATAAICRRAGIGSGTLFHYFPTKQDIFRGIFAADQPQVTRLCEQALAAADPDAGLDLIIDRLVAELADPLAPGLASAATLQAHRDPQLAELLTAIDSMITHALTTLSSRLPRTLPMPASSTARWIQNLIDARHLGVITGPDEPTTAELRRILSWLLARE
jgi:AcrR family transcriptional regulator